MMHLRFDSFFFGFGQRQLGAAALAFAFAFAGSVQAQQAQQARPAGATSTAPATASMAVSPEYRLGAGDALHISVFQNPDLTLDARVTEGGVVSYPLLGNVHVGGLSVSDAEKRIADGLRTGGFVKQPQVNILVSQVRGSQASVLGQVGRPGRFPIETTDLRLTDLLAEAGGALPTGADLVTIVGTRNGKPFRQEIDLPSVFAPDQRGVSDVFIQNGDVVWVDRAPIVYIYGEVQRPGPLRLERGMTVMQALAAGGGLTQRGTEKGMRVHRKDADGKIAIIQPGMDDAVKDGDVVYVRESLF